MFPKLTFLRDDLMFVAISAVALIASLAWPVIGPLLVLATVALAVLRAPPLMIGAPARIMAVAAITVALLWPAFAMAQAVDTAGTKINLGGIFSDIRPTLETVLASVLGVALTWAAATVQRSTGLSIQARHREALQSSLMNGVHAGLDLVGHAADRTDVDVKSRLVAEAIRYTRQYAPQAVSYFKLGDGALADLARAQLGKVGIALPAAPAAAK